MINRAIWALILIWLVPTQGSAADIEVSDLGDGQSMIAVSGDIVSGDSAKFNKLAAQLDTAIVVLESDGGVTVEAIKIGETIRIRGFSTLVLNGSTCASACGLIWLAGSPRVLPRSAKVGFHATYTDEAGRKLESGVGNALVGRYFAILNLPQKAIIFATSAPPDKINWLSPANGPSIGVEVNVIDDFEPEEEASQQEQPVLRIAPPPIFKSPSPSQDTAKRLKSDTSFWAKIGEWSVVTDHTLGDGCFMIRTFNDGTTFRLGIDLKFDKQSYLMIGNDDWASIEVGENYKINIQLDDNDPWVVNAKGFQIGTAIVLQASFADLKFWDEFATSRFMYAERDGKMFLSLPLTDSSRGVDGVIDCQKAASELRKQRDPFAK